MPEPVSGRPVQAPRVPAPVKQARAQAAPGQLIDRTMVASALDRHGAGGPASAPDGVIGDDELADAGIGNVASDARGQIVDGNGQITVKSLAAALQDDRVMITADGIVKVTDGKATLPNGRIVAASPWQFPVVPDENALIRYHQLVPNLGRYNPNWPDSYYYDHVYVGTERVQVGTHRVYDGTDSNGQAKYHDEPDYEDRPKYEDRINYSRLRGDLESVTFQVLQAMPSVDDPQLQAARTKLEAASRSSGGLFWGDENRCRDLYDALNALDNIHVPGRPEDIVGDMNSTLNAAKAKVDDQARITAAYGLPKVQAAVAKEVDRLHGFTLAKGLGLFLGAGAAGAAGYFGLASVLAAGPLIGAAAGVALLGAGIGFFIGKLINDGAAKGLAQDLATFKAIDPAANRKELEQHALAAYELLQTARDKTDLAGLRDFEGKANQVSKAMQAVADRATDQTKQLKALEGLVVKYGKA